MKHLKKFNENSEFKNPFNDRLFRGVKNPPSDKYIDDPSKREIKIGFISEWHDGYDQYKEYMNNFKNYGIPCPTKSVHMLCCTAKMMKKYSGLFGEMHSVSPESGSKFGFCKFAGGGGIGDTWFKTNIIYSKYFNERIKPLSDEIDNPDYSKLCDKYVKKMIDNDIIGSMSYDELLEYCYKPKSDIITFIWTDSPCLIEKYEINSDGLRI